MMKLSKPTDISARSKIKIICLPEANKSYYNPPIKTSQYYNQPKPKPKPPSKSSTNKKHNQNRKPTQDSIFKYLEKINNLTRSVLSNMLSNKPKNMRYNIRVAVNKTDSLNTDGSSFKIVKRENMRRPNNDIRSRLMWNDDDDVIVNNTKVNEEESQREGKKLHFVSDDLYNTDPISAMINTNHLGEGSECFVTGWGRSQTNGSLTDTLLEAEVPPLPIEHCLGKYPENLPLKAGHLCAGNTDGSSGTCVVNTFSYTFNINFIIHTNNTLII